MAHEMSLDESWKYWWIIWIDTLLEKSATPDLGAIRLTLQRNLLSQWSAYLLEINAKDLWLDTFVLLMNINEFSIFLDTSYGEEPLQWRHNERDGVSNYPCLRCFLRCGIRRRSKKTSKFRVTGLYAGNSPVTGEFSAQMVRNEKNAFIWWRHHAMLSLVPIIQDTMKSFIHFKFKYLFLHQ